MEPFLGLVKVSVYLIIESEDPDKQNLQIKWEHSYEELTNRNAF